MSTTLVIINAPEHNGWRSANGMTLEVRSTPFNKDDPGWEEADLITGVSYCVLVNAGNDEVIEKVSKSGTWRTIRKVYELGLAKISASHIINPESNNQDMIDQLPPLDDFYAREDQEL